MSNKNLIKTDISEALQSVEIILREGIPLSKGVILTQKYLESEEDLLKQYMDFFIQYPDHILTRKDSFNLSYTGF